MDTGKNELSKEICEELSGVFKEEPTAEEIALDRKYTDIQTVTSMIC